MFFFITFDTEAEGEQRLCIRGSVRLSVAFEKDGKETLSLLLLFIMLII